MLYNYKKHKSKKMFMYVFRGTAPVEYFSQKNIESTVLLFSSSWVFFG